MSGERSTDEVLTLTWLCRTKEGNSYYEIKTGSCIRECSARRWANSWSIHIGLEGRGDRLHRVRKSHYL